MLLGSPRTLHDAASQGRKSLPAGEEHGVAAIPRDLTVAQPGIYY